MIKIMEPRKQIFTHQEKKKFLEILKNYSREVENKNTNSSALKAKNMAWLKITSEFNSSPQTNLHRTPKQLRRLWMNLKHRQREAVSKSIQALHPKGHMDEIISGSNVRHITQALISSVASSVDSDTVLETTNADLTHSEISLCLSNESQYISNQETPVFSTVKIEPMSPIVANPSDTMEATPQPIKNSRLTPNNNELITPQEDKQDNKLRLQRSLELEDLEAELLREKVRYQRQENKTKEAYAAALHNLEYQILKEKLREAKAKANLAELYLRRQNFTDD